MSASRDSSLRVWDVQRGREVANVYTYDNLACLARRCAGGTVAAGTKAGTVGLWCVSPAQRLVASQLRNGRNTSWPNGAGMCSSIAGATQAPTAAQSTSVLGRRTLGACVRTSGRRRVRRLPYQGTNVHLSKLHRSKSSIVCIAYATYPLVAADCLPPTSSRRNLETKRRLATLRGHTEEVTCVTALAADGEQPLWASGALDATVRLWDARTPAAAVASLEGCRRRVYASTLPTCQWVSRSATS